MRRSFFTVFLIMLFLTSSALPLRFRVLEEKTGRVLYLYDCFRGKDAEPCQPYENHFSAQDPANYGDYPGDDAVFRQKLREGRFSEVWLYSGGGALVEAIRMAQDLRATHLTVRVPKHTFCVSACTVMFMGGYLRVIDPDATYQVHSASKWAEAADLETHQINPNITKIAGQPEEELFSFVREEQVGARFKAKALLRLFQNTLLIPTGKPFEDEDLQGVGDWAERDLPRLDYSNPSDQERLQDVKRIHAEGRAAVQDILMRLEREQMAAAIHELEQRTDLGYRSDAALEMVRMMYMESIRETSTLSQSELERRGYVTPQIK